MSVITAPAVHRQRCYRCWRPVATCFCGELRAVPTRTRIVILQHPHERCHPFGTARLVSLCLPRSRIHVAYKGLSGDLNCPVDVPRDAAVLFPHPSAVDLADLPAAERPTTLVVLDEAELAQFDPSFRFLHNVNTPDDYQRAVDELRP